jgi:hypothetical protein
VGADLAQWQIARPDAVPRGHYRTAPAGIAIGLTGAASVGVGLWWWLHRHDERSAPVVSLGASHAVLGWAGRF